MSDKGQLKISILHPGENVSPLKCREWLRHEAASIQAEAGEWDIILIRLFLPARLLSSVTPRKIDEILSRIVNEHRNIQRVELRTVPASMTHEELAIAAKEAQLDIQEMLKGVSSSDTIH